MKLNPIVIKKDQNYVAFFLTLACNLKCPYCINLHENNTKNIKRQNLSAEEWITAADRLSLREDLPLTFQGGEPTLFPGFYKIVKEVKKDIKMDLLTNMMFDVDEFIENVPVWRFTRQAPYASIRVSYHPGQNDIDDLMRKTAKMQNAGFRVGLYSVLHPDEKIRAHILKVQKACLDKNIDFRLKDFLGEYNGRLYGSYKYENVVSSDQRKSCECRTTELIVDPSGHVYRCHADLYNARSAVAHILDKTFKSDDIYKYRKCDWYGKCNPCDVKVKTNRLQIFGHTSVEIKDIKDLSGASSGQNEEVKYGSI